MAERRPGIPRPGEGRSIAQLAPNMPEAKRAKLAQASRWPWHTTGDVNEGHTFERKYREITNYYYAQALPNAGKAILHLFNMYRPVAEAICKEFTYSTEKVNGSFIGDEAAGAMETTIRPLVRPTFHDAARIVIDWTQNTVGAAWPAGAQIHVVPSERAWALGSRHALASENEETYLILGWAEVIQDAPVYTALRDWINDGQGWRLPNYFFPNHGLTNLMLMQYGSPRWVETNHQYKAESWARVNKNTALWPLGIEVLTAAKHASWQELTETAVS